MKKHMQTILITGASGMLGLKLVEVLSKHYAIINDQFDITDPVAIAAFQSLHIGIDVIIHCAAMTDVNACELNHKLCRQTNVTGTANITRLAKHYEAKLIYISTPMVFSGTTGDYRESDSPNPQNFYARSKLAGEKIVLRYRRGLVVRVNPIGKRPLGFHPSFVQWFVDRARKNESFSLFSDVNINPISTTTLARAFDITIWKFRPGIMHLGSRHVVNKADVWRLIMKKFPRYSGIVREESVRATEAGKIAKRPRRMWLNVDKSRRFGIAPPSWRREVEIVLKELNL